MTQSLLHDIVEQSTNLAPSTKDKYLRDLNAWIEYAGDDPKNWTRRVAQNFYAHLLDRMKPQSANRLIASVAYAAKWWSIQEDNPAFDFVRVQMQSGSEKVDKVVLSELQAKALLATCNSKTAVDVRDFAMIVVALETGMRRMSLRSMTFEHNFLVRDAKAGYPTAHVLMKGRGKERVFVPLSDAAILALSSWYVWLADYFDTDRGPIFRSVAKHGIKIGKTPLSEAAIHKIIAERGEACGIEVSPHVFRHTFVTWRLDAGFPPHEVAAVTSHALPELGALGSYANRVSFCGKMRSTTPAWLDELVRRRCK